MLSCVSSKEPANSDELFIYVNNERVVNMNYVYKHDMKFVYRSGRWRRPIQKICWSCPSRTSGSTIYTKDYKLKYRKVDY